MPSREGRSTGTRKTATRKTPARKAPAKKAAAKAPAKKAPARRSAPAGGRQPAKRLPAAQQAARDSLMIARLAQGWTWEAIAGEANLSVKQAQRAVEARRVTAPLKLTTDPVRIIEHVFEGIQLSIGDLEAMSSAAIEKNQLAVAVGAKGRANDAREKLIMVLQATGRLPQELGALRHLIDLRAIGVQMLDTMDAFERDAELAASLQDPAEREQVMRSAVAKVRTTFAELMGMDQQPAIEGRISEEVPA